MASSGAQACAVHLDSSSSGHCRQCSKPYCNECRVEDVATDESFCSKDCIESWRTRSSGAAAVDNHQLLAEFATPVRSGWKLWLRCIPTLSLHTVPLAMVMTLLSTLPTMYAIDDTGAETVSELAMWIWLALGSFGVAMTQVVMTQKYSGLVRGNPYLVACKRFVPWAAATALVIGIIMLGYVLLIIPGIYLSLRLFWAEEFVLIHQVSPLQGLRESWELTRDRAGSIFGFQFLAGIAAYVTLLFTIGILVGAVALLGQFVSTGFGEIPVRLLLFWAMFTLYAGWHAPEIVYLYGMRAERAVKLADAGNSLGL